MNLVMLCSKLPYPAFAHPSLAALNWKSGNKIIVYQLPVQLRMLCCWPMKCQAETQYPRGLRFPVPLDKGNEGSGNEIAHIATRVHNLFQKQNSRTFPGLRLIVPGL